MKYFIILIAFTFSFFAQTSNSIIENFLKKNKLEHMQLGLSARYINSDNSLIDYNSKFSLCPASGLKMITTASALHYLGEDFNFTTKFYYSGKISKKGILQGHLYVQGGFDPTFASDLIDSSYSLNNVVNILISKLKELGINEIQGSIYTDPIIYSDSKTVPDMWYWEDLGNYYGAAISGLCVNDNLYKIYFEMDKAKVGSKALVKKTEPLIKNLKFESNLVFTSPTSSDNGYIFRADDSYKAKIFGTIPLKKDFVIRGSIPEPAKFFAEYLKEQLIKNNIKVTRIAKSLDTSTSYKDKILFYEHKSPILKQIVRMTNLKSFNLYAEMLLRAIGYFIKKDYSLASGIDLVNKYMTELKIDTKPFMIFDGCGLSRSNVITADLMVNFLIAVSKKNIFNSFYSSLGMIGDNEIHNSFGKFASDTELKGNVRMKTGYIKNVRTHSGYLTAKSGKIIAFSFISNNFNCSTSIINDFHKELMIHLYYNY